MKRRKAREYALQILYQYDITKTPPNRNVLDSFWKEHNCSEDIRRFTEELVTGTINNLSDIDFMICTVAENWELERIAAVDRNILRSATYELLYKDDIPAAVTLNEAIEIAKKYSTGDSSSFINGLLDKVTQRIKKKVH